MPDSPKNSGRALVLLALTAASLVGLLLLPPIHQDQNYHDFADQRTILGIPHFWNVVSNLLFIAVGVVGVGQFRRDAAIALLFLTMVLTVITDLTIAIAVGTVAGLALRLIRKDVEPEEWTPSDRSQL